MTAAAGSLQCPNCGAPAQPGAVRCDYCRTTLATVSCPRCFEPLFDGSAFCPHCGLPRSRAEREETTSTRCPACRAAMRWVKVGDVDLLECTGCDGTWIETATFERVCADRDRQAIVVNRAVTPPTAPPSGPVKYRPCPKCGKLMNRFNFGHVSGTVVDVCRGHGTFFDSGELHRVVEFILNGGLDRARAIDREALAEEERRLRGTPADRDGDTRSAEDKMIDLLRAMRAGGTGTDG